MKERLNKMDYIITNPPYNKTLYLDILEYLIKNCSESEIVSVNPNQHLSNIFSSLNLRHKSTETVFEKYENTVYKHIKDIKFYNNEKFNEIFNINYMGAGAIYHIKPQETFEIYKTAFQDSIENGNLIFSTFSKIIKKVLKQETIQKRYGFHDEGNLIAIGKVNGQRYIKGSLLSDIHKRVYKTKSEFFENFRGDKDKSKKPREFLNFKSSEEAQNFIDCFDTEFMMFYIKGIHDDVSLLSNYIPILDMTQKWTNEKLCEYYNVSKEEFNACLEWYKTEGI